MGDWLSLYAPLLCRGLSSTRRRIHRHQHEGPHCVVVFVDLPSRLSLNPRIPRKSRMLKWDGAPGGTRTPNPQVRSLEVALFGPERGRIRLSLGRAGGPAACRAVLGPAPRARDSPHQSVEAGVLVANRIFCLKRW